MTRKWCILATVLVALMSIGVIACKNDDGSPSGPSPIEYTAPTSSTTSNTTPNNPPASPNNPPANQGIDFDWTRGKDFFGSGYSCSREGVGPTWKSPVVEVKVTNNTSGDIDMGYQVFGEKEPGCGATVTPRAGARDILVMIDGPETLGPGQSATYRWRIDLTHFSGQACGEFQFGWGFNDAAGRFHNERDRVINVGNSCAPPPPPENPGCPANARNEITATSTEGEGRFCYRVSWSSNQPGPYAILDNNDPIPGAQGQQNGSAVVCYDNGEEEHEFRFKAGECDPFTNITTPPLECRDYQPPQLSITGSPSVNTTDSMVTVNEGSIGPAGVTFSTSLPFDVQRPDYGENPESWEFTAYLEQSYGPEELECSVKTSKDFSGEVEPKEPTCEQEHAPEVISFSLEGTVNETYDCKRVGLCGFSGNNCRVNDANRCVGKYTGHDYGPANIAYERENPIVCEATVANQGNWLMSLGSNSRPVSSTGEGDKATDSEVLECGSRTTLRATYNWKHHGDRDWTCALYLNGSQETSDTIDGH